MVPTSASTCPLFAWAGAGGLTGKQQNGTSRFVEGWWGGLAKRFYRYSAAMPGIFSYTSSEPAWPALRAAAARAGPQQFLYRFVLPHAHTLFRAGFFAILLLPLRIALLTWQEPASCSASLLSPSTCAPAAFAAAVPSAGMHDTPA